MKILLLIIFSLQVLATSVTPLPFGHAALIYNAFPVNGPFANPTTNPMTNHPGYWINNILSFNANAANQMSINRLYVYGTSLDTLGYTNTVNYNNSYAKAQGNRILI